MFAGAVCCGVFANDPNLLLTACLNRLALSSAEQKTVATAQRSKFPHLANEPVAPAPKCLETFRLCVSAITLVANVPLRVGPEHLPPFMIKPPSANGDHDDGNDNNNDKVDSVLSRLWRDLSDDHQFVNLRSHVRKHLVVSWSYHLLGAGCACHAGDPVRVERNNRKDTNWRFLFANITIPPTTNVYVQQVGQFRGFAHHFLHGLCHWTGNHYFCRLGAAQVHPPNQQLGRFPLEENTSQQQRLALAKKLFIAMVRAARQYESGRQFLNTSCWTTGPAQLPFDPAFDRNDIDLGVQWGEISTHLLL